MPDITDAKRITAKLSEFDDRMNGAIDAATAIMKAKASAASILDELRNMRIVGKEDATSLAQSHKEWEHLKNEWQKTINQVNAAGLSLDEHLADAVDRLVSEFHATIEEQREKIIETSDLAQQTKEFRDEVMQANNKLVDLLANVREKLQSAVNSEFQRLAGLLQDRHKNARSELLDRLTKFEDLFKSQIDSFRQETDRSIQVHQHGVEKKIDEFLARQNLLVQNLQQQIDGFQQGYQKAQKELGEFRNQMQVIEQEKRALQQLTGTQQIAIAKLQEQIDGIDTRLNNARGLFFRI